MHLFAKFLFISATLSLVAAPKKPEIPVPTVLVEPAKSTLLFDLLSYPARVNPKINASVLAESDGVVSKILTPLGTAVSKHQKTLLIKNTDPIYDYAPFVVTAPVKGTVSSIEVTEGSRVARGQRLMSITDPKQVVILIEVAVSDLSLIRSGIQGELNFATGELKPTPVKVVGVSPFVDSATGTATAELTFAAENTQLLPPGLVGTVTFRANEHAGFQIPESAVVYRGRESFVRIVADGKAKYAAVTLGMTRHGLTEVLSGLTPEMQVVIRSSSFLSEGEAVTVRTPEGPKS